MNFAGPMTDADDPRQPDSVGEADPRLLDVLGQSKALGFLGPGPVIDHVVHARALLEAVPEAARTFIDLGSGGGVPGLVVAVERPTLAGVLLDGSTRRGAFLREAVEMLALQERIDVCVERAEIVGRDPAFRSMTDVVLARSFGPPAVVAECAAPLLAIGGRLIVSDPPGRPTRWPDEPLAKLGLQVSAHQVGPPAYTVLVQYELCAASYPRRVGIPAKRVLF